MRHGTSRCSAGVCGRWCLNAPSPILRMVSGCRGHSVRQGWFMARLVYACRFDVTAKDGIGSVLSTYTDWIVGHYRGRRELPDFNFEPESAGAPEGLPSRHSLSSSTYQYGDERVVRIRWSFPDDNDGGLRWANEVRVGQFGDRCGVEHLISIESVEYSVSARLIPQLIRRPWPERWRPVSSSMAGARRAG